MCGFAEFKITILGVRSVGKSEINLQFSGYDSMFNICSKRIVVDEKECEIELIDLSSADVFRAMKESFIQWANGYVLMYSVTDRMSFEDIPSIHARVLCIKDRTHMPMILVGNKCDLDLDRVVSYRQGEVLAELLEVKFLETSAKDGTNLGMCEFGEFKIAILGVGSVGKSEINLQFCGYLSNFAICRKRIIVDEKECGIELMDLPSANELQARKDSKIHWANGSVELNSWVCPQPENAIKDSIMHWANGYVLMYSVTDRNSFEDIPSIHARVLCIKGRTHMPMILVGNKCDLDLDRVVSYRQGEVLAESLDVKFLETSAKDGTNVDQVFYDIVREIQRCKTVTKEKQPQQQQRKKCSVL